MTAVRDTILELAAARGASLAELSRMLGRNAAYLQQFVARGSPRVLAERDRRMLARFFAVGEDRLGASDPEGSGGGGIAIPYLAVTAAAGAGAVAGEERIVRQEYFAPQMLQAAGVDAAMASIIDARGDSMAPTILSGDRLLVDRGDRTVRADPAIFVLRRDETLQVKRVSRAGRRLTIGSDNPDYAPAAANIADVAVVGRVKLLLRAP